VPERRRRVLQRDSSAMPISTDGKTDSWLIVARLAMAKGSQIRLRVPPGHQCQRGHRSRTANCAQHFDSLCAFDDLLSLDFRQCFDKLCVVDDSEVLHRGVGLVSSSHTRLHVLSRQHQFWNRAVKEIHPSTEQALSARLSRAPGRRCAFGQCPKGRPMLRPT